MIQLCSFAVLCIRHAAPDQAAYHHEVLRPGSGTGHLPHCLPRGELPQARPHQCHEHLLQVCCHQLPISNRSWDHAAVSTLVKLTWLITCTGCQHCIHPALMPYPSNRPFCPLSVPPPPFPPPASTCTASLGQDGQKVGLRPSLLYMLAGLSVSDTPCQQLHWVVACPIPT